MMKLKLLLLLVGFFQLTLTAQTVEKIAICDCESRLAASAFSIGDIGYVGLGEISDDQNDFYHSFWSFDGKTESWKSIAPFPGEGRKSAIAFSLNGKGYVGCGETFSSSSGPQSLKDFYEYDPKTDTWTQIADFPGDRREEGLAFVIDGVAYVGFGQSDRDDKTFRDIYKFDGDNWIGEIDVPDGLWETYAAGVVVSKGKGYITGGYSAGYPNRIYSYAPATETWTLEHDNADEFPIFYNPIELDFEGNVLFGGAHQDENGDFVPSKFFELNVNDKSITDLGNIANINDFSGHQISFCLEGGHCYFGLGGRLFEDVRDIYRIKRDFSSSNSNIANRDIVAQPTPTSDLLFITGISSDEVSSLLLTNSLGQTQDRTWSRNQNGMSVDVSDCQSGSYWLIISLKDQTKVWKKISVIK